MEKRSVGRFGLHVSVIGLGCSPLGGGVWGPADDDASIRACYRALDLGINLFDTAPLYGYGHSEELVGRAIRGRRHEVVLATKCGVEWNDQGEKKPNSSRGRILKEIDDSLNRLGVDVIDLYQIHAPDVHTPLEETMSTMLELQQQGKIRAIGVSNFSLAQIQEALQYARLDAHQPAYNMIQRELENDVLPFCRQHEIATLAHSSIYQGLLAGKYFFSGTRPSDPLRREHPELQGERYTIMKEALADLKEIADEKGVPLAQLAINWVLCQPGISSALCGARNLQQVEENAAAATWVLTRQDLQQIDGILAERERKIRERVSRA